MPSNQNPVFTNDSLTGDGTEDNPLAVAGPGGGITEVESSDDSVTVSNGTGPTVDLSVAPTGFNEGQIGIWDGTKWNLSPNPGGQVWEIVNNGDGATRIQGVGSSGGGELMLLENTNGSGVGVILNLGAGAGSGGTGGAFLVRQNGNLTAKGPNINFAGLQVFANNADAIAGGLNQWDLYRTGSDPDVICIVH